jgi:tetratricopeptide (TPR) repeat protein
MNFLKTYYESAIKEHMYLTGDYDRAQEAGDALIALDPVWPPSYAEVAEVHRKFGDTERAAGLFEKAAALGPPYVGHHMAAAARCHEALGNDERAIGHYLALAEIAPLSESIAAAGLRLAEKLSHPARARFEPAVARVAEPTAGPAR